MKRRGWKWVLLFLGVILISATCGFGYELNRSRTEFEVSKEAFAKRDWEHVVSNLSQVQFNPPSKKYVAFLRNYLDPILDSNKAKLHHERTSSQFTPIENEFLSYRTPGLSGQTLIVLSYRDKIEWVSIPFMKGPVGIFKGHQTGMLFVAVFYRVASNRFPHSAPGDHWRSIIEFVQHERRQLDELGITPSDLHSLSKTWEDFVKERTELAKKYPNAEYPIRLR